MSHKPKKRNKNKSAQFQNVFVKKNSLFYIITVAAHLASRALYPKVLTEARKID